MQLQLNTQFDNFLKQLINLTDWALGSAMENCMEQQHLAHPDSHAGHQVGHITLGDSITAVSFWKWIYCNLDYNLKLQPILVLYV